ALCQAGWKFLDDRRLLTTRHHVVAPVYASVKASVTVVRSRTAADPSSTIQDNVARAIRKFLHPLVGRDGTGWPFGGDTYVSDLYPVLQGVPGVASIDKLELSPGDDKATVMTHPRGDLIGPALAPHHLPRADLT